MSNEDKKKCPFCAEEISIEAKKCKHCGEILDPTLLKGTNSELAKKKEWSPGVAAVLSLVVPGAGQIYKGHLGTGLIWLFVVVIGYVLLIVPGLILHIICIVTAYSGDPYKK